MNYKHHLIPGVVLTAIFIWIFHNTIAWNIPTIITLILITLISPLLPDIDHESSEIQQVFIGLGLLTAASGILLYFLKIPGGIIFVVGGVLLAAMTFFTGQIAHHRGMIHSLQFCIAWGLAVLIITNYGFPLNPWFGLLAFASCWSHLWFDGIPFKITAKGGEPHE
jgi:hypothetical protein